MTCRCRATDSVVIVRGALDLAHSRRLSFALDDVLATAPKRLVIDLREAELIDSSGLAVLVRARRRALRQGVELVLACDVPSTLKVFTLTGLNRSFRICPTTEAALRPVPNGHDVTSG